VIQEYYILPDLLTFLNKYKYNMSSSGKVKGNSNYKCTLVTKNSIKHDKNILECNLFKYFNIIKELTWIFKDGMYIQIHIMCLDKIYKPPKWKDRASDNFYIHISNDFKFGYDQGRYNIPVSLMLPFRKTQILGIPIRIPNQTVTILKKWYGANCITHFPKSLFGKDPKYNNSSLDITRFETSNKKILTNFSL